MDCFSAFLAQARAEEREACARVVEKGNPHDHRPGWKLCPYDALAAAIRVRRDEG